MSTAATFEGFDTDPGPPSPFAMENPFEAAPAAPLRIPEAPRESVKPNYRAESADLIQKIAQARTAYAASLIENMASYIAGGISRATGIVWMSFKSILSQAVMMALFKFAIEACAMMIKTLVEKMTGMKLQPPNIDTHGVSYNLSQINGTAPAQSTQTNTSRPGYDNPFSSPFNGGPAW